MFFSSNPRGNSRKLALVINTDPKEIKAKKAAVVRMKDEEHLVFRAKKFLIKML